MPVSASTLKALMAAGVTGDALVTVVEAIDADMAVVELTPAPRSAAAQRQARYRARKAWNVTETVTRDVTRDVTPPRQEGSPPPPFQETQPPQKGTLKGSQKGTPFEELSAVLDETRARAVVEHRQRIGKALTPYAASLLAKKLSEWPDANEAADAMIANGWQGFKPEWMDRQRRSTGPPSKPTLGDILRATQRELEALENGPDPSDMELPAIESRNHPYRRNADEDADLLPRSAH